jgi:threonine/homoserine/homoserine lactone efflux protein
MLALALATIVLGLAPGPAVVATVGRSLASGFGRKYLFILGIVFGDLLFSLIAMSGFSIIHTHSSVLLVLKIIGGCYLILLGVQNWRGSAALAIGFSAPATGRKLFFSGLLLTASNPKDLLFFIGFLPLFVDVTHLGPLKRVMAAGVIGTSFLLTLSFYAVMAEAARKWFENRTAMRRVHQIAGVLLAVAGILALTA